VRLHVAKIVSTGYKEYVEQCFADISAIANSIQAIAIEKGAQ